MWKECYMWKNRIVCEIRSAVKSNVKNHQQWYCVERKITGEYDVNNWFSFLILCLLAYQRILFTLVSTRGTRKRTSSFKKIFPVRNFSLPLAQLGWNHEVPFSCQIKRQDQVSWPVAQQTDLFSQLSGAASHILQGVGGPGPPFFSLSRTATDFRLFPSKW